MLNNDPQNLEQFNLLQEQIFQQNLVGKLSNWRPLGNKYNQKASTIVSGYYRQILMIDRMLVKNKASKELVIS